MAGAERATGWDRAGVRGLRGKGTALVLALVTGLAGASVLTSSASGDASTATSGGAVSAAVAPPTRLTPVPVGGKFGLLGGVTLSSSPDTSWWGTNGRVMDMETIGSRVYLGGAFDYIGPNTGHGSRVLGSTGALQPDNQVMTGDVRAAVPDGSGGWFVGGDFQRIGSTYQPSLAHVLSDGTLADWKPIPKGNVYALARVGSDLLVGGDFTAIGGAAATHLAMVDTTTGSQVAGWTAPATNGTVEALAASGSRVFVGGSFTTVGGAARRGLVALSSTTGAVDTTFTGAATGTVFALAADVTSGQIFAGGDFLAVTLGSSSVARGRVAAFSLTGNTLTSFAPVADGTVYALDADGAGSLWAGGSFTAVGGATHVAVAKMTTDGVVDAFNARITGCHGTHGIDSTYGFYPCTPTVMTIDVSGGTAYLGGLFSNAGGEVRHNAAAFATSSGTLTVWDPRPGNLVLATASSGSDVFIGGELTSVGGLLRTGLAALDSSTGAGVAGFSADTNEAVVTLLPASGGTRLLVGGSFTQVQGQVRNHLAAITVATGVLDPAFHPSFNDAVLDMDLTGNLLYVGGKFTTVSGVSHAHVVKINAISGGIYTYWATTTTGLDGPLTGGGEVQGIQVAADASKVYIAGPFTAVRGHSVAGGIAVVTGFSGALVSHQLGGVTSCTGKNGAWVNRLYLSDDGKRLYGGGYCPDNIYQWDAVDLSAHKAQGLNWVTVCNAGMQGRLEVNGHFYYGSHGGDLGKGGWCDLGPGLPRVSQQRFFAFRVSDGVLDPFAPQFDTAMGIWSFAVVPGKGLLVGGDFTFAGDSQTVARGVALFPGNP